MTLNRTQKSSLFFLLFAGVIVAASVNASVGSFASPGPGLLPCLAASLLGCFSLISLIRPIFTKGQTAEKTIFSSEGVNWKSLVSTLGALFAFPFVLRYLGFGPTMFGFMLFMAKVVGDRKWTSSLLFSLITTSISYLLFVYWLQFFVDKGILGLY
jgi:hypothetical protein